MSTVVFSFLVLWLSAALVEAGRRSLALFERSELASDDRAKTLGAPLLVGEGSVSERQGHVAFQADRTLRASNGQSVLKHLFEYRTAHAAWQS